MLQGMMSDYEGPTISADSTLDHHATVEAIEQAFPWTDRAIDFTAEDVAFNLARAGYALVRIGRGPDFTTRQED